MPLTTPPIGAAPLYARNKLTGQTFLVGPTTKMIDDLGDVDTSTTGPTGGSALIWDETVSQWVPGVASTVAGIDDLTDVDTGTTGPTDGQALVWDDAAGQWVPGPGGLQISTDVDNEVMLGTDGGLFSNEVHLGPTGPTLSGPDLWANPDEGTLYAAATGPTGGTEWVPVGGSEVEVDAVEPTTDWELWVDTSTQSPLPGAPVGLALDDLTDVDTVTVAPAVGDGLSWDGTNWVPTVPGAPPVLDFLPLAGGTLTGPLTTVAVIANGTITANAGIVMGSGDRIDFPGATGTKINLYGTTFGLAVESGATVAFVPDANKFAFRSGTSTGAEWVFIDKSGIGPRTSTNVAWTNGWSGTAQFRVNPAMVTLAFNGVTMGNTGVKILSYPAGVPAPWMTCSASVTTLVPLSLPGMPLGGTMRIEARPDGVYAINEGAYSGLVTLSISWAR